MDLTAGEGVALVIIEKTCILINVWSCTMMRKYTVNAETRASPFIPKSLNKL